MTPSPASVQLPTGPSLLSLFELGGRVVLLGVALLYALGFVVENIHLARFNYFALTLFERRYALAGFWALSPLLLFFLFDWLVRTGTYPRSASSPQRKWLGEALSWLGSIALFYAFQSAFSGLFGISFSLVWLPFVYGAGILYMLAARKAINRWRELTTSPPLAVGELHQSPPVSPWILARSVLSEVEWVFVFVAASYLVLFTYVLFPKIPASWGGGGVERVQLLLPRDDATLLRALGVDGVTPQLSLPVTLVATTADGYVLLIDSTRVAYVRRDVVQAVFLKGRFKTLAPIRTAPTPIDTTPSGQAPKSPNAPSPR